MVNILFKLPKLWWYWDLIFSNRVICHYEIHIGSFVFCEDVLEHAEGDKQNILHPARDSKCSLTSNITRAVCEVLGHVVKQCQKRRKSSESVRTIFNNLRRKNQVYARRQKQSSQGVQYWWNKMYCDMPKVVTEADRDWSFILNDNQSISCLHFDTKLWVKLCLSLTRRRTLLKQTRFMITNIYRESCSIRYQYWDDHCWKGKNVYDNF